MCGWTSSTATPAAAATLAALNRRAGLSALTALTLLTLARGWPALWRTFLATAGLSLEAADTSVTGDARPHTITARPARRNNDALRCERTVSRSRLASQPLRCRILILPSRYSPQNNYLHAEHQVDSCHFSCVLGLSLTQPPAQRPHAAVGPTCPQRPRQLPTSRRGCPARRCVRPPEQGSHRHQRWSTDGGR